MQVSFKNSMIAGIMAGILATILNLIYMYAFETMSHVSFPQIIHFGSVTGSTMAPMLLGAIVYFGLCRWTQRPNMYFFWTCVGFTAISMAGPMMPTLPDGSPRTSEFVMLTAPMHVIAGMVGAYMIPWFAKNRATARV